MMSSGIRGAPTTVPRSRVARKPVVTQHHLPRSSTIEMTSASATRVDPPILTQRSSPRPSILSTVDLLTWHGHSAAGLERAGCYEVVAPSENECWTRSVCLVGGAQGRHTEKMGPAVRVGSMLWPRYSSQCSAGAPRNSSSGTP